MKLGDLLPFAKKQVSHSVAAQENHKRYLQALILTSTNQEKDLTADWLRFFELKNMKWKKDNFPGDLANLKQALTGSKTTTANPIQIPASK